MTSFTLTNIVYLVDSQDEEVGITDTLGKVVGHYEALLSFQDFSSISYEIIYAWAVTLNQTVAPGVCATILSPPLQEHWGNWVARQYYLEEGIQVAFRSEGTNVNQFVSGPIIVTLDVPSAGITLTGDGTLIAAKPITVINAPTTPPTTLPETVLPPVLEGEFWKANESAFTSPIEIYRFTYAKSDPALSSDAVVNDFWYTSSEETGVIYRRDSLAVPKDFEITPETIKRNEVSITQEINKSNIQLDVTKNFPIAKWFISGAPAFNIFVEGYRGYLTAQNTVLESSALCFFKGRVVTCTFKGVEASLFAEPIYTHVQKAGLRRNYETGCAHTLYGEDCRGSSTNMKSANEVTGLGLSVGAERNKVIYTGTCAAETWTNPPSSGLLSTSGVLTGGMLEMVNGETFLITQHLPNVLTLSRQIPLETDISVMRVYKGCDHMLSTCAARFTNQVNFGGFPYMIPSNPFVGTHVPQG